MQKNLTRLGGGLLAALLLSPAQAAGIATWNLAWLLDQASHSRWVAACDSVQWRTARELEQEGKPMPASLRGLPYCDVHNGLEYGREAKCKAELGEVYYQRPNQQASSCRVAPDLADWKQYERKLQGLREGFAALDKAGVTLVALQEVSNDAAVQAVLPEGWKVRTTADMPGVPAMPQQIGVAWKPAGIKLDTASIKPVLELTLEGERPLRPGLTFSAKLNGKATDFLLVHLKAGCRSQPMDQPSGQKPNQACSALAQQTTLLERWIDERAGKRFVVMGDFNRSLLRERDSYGTKPLVQFGTRENAVVSAMLPEWNDNQPEGSTVVVLDHLRKEGEGGDGLVAGSWHCGYTKGIDHVVISGALAADLGDAERIVRPMGFTLDGKPLAVRDPSVVAPSDHCARYVSLD